jgi:hypothetical protein
MTGNPQSVPDEEKGGEEIHTTSSGVLCNTERVFHTSHTTDISDYPLSASDWWSHLLSGISEF